MHIRPSKSHYGYSRKFPPMFEKGHNDGIRLGWLKLHDGKRGASVRDIFIWQIGWVSKLLIHLYQTPSIWFNYSNITWRQVGNWLIMLHIIVPNMQNQHFAPYLCVSNVGRLMFIGLKYASFCFNLLIFMKTSVCNRYHIAILASGF